MLVLRIANAALRCAQKFPCIMRAFTDARLVFRWAAAIVLICAWANAAEWNTSGSMSEKLLLTVSFEPVRSQFTIVLGNRSKAALNLQVESRVFHGKVIVKRRSGELVEYFDARFIPALKTSTWVVPNQMLQPQQEIIWRLSAADLRDIHDNAFDPQMLEGATVYASLDEVAEIPPKSGPASYISDNARQVSKPIKMSSVITSNPN